MIKRLLGGIIYERAVRVSQQGRVINLERDGDMVSFHGSGFRADHLSG
jgi:hypothetical protein